MESEIVKGVLYSFLWGKTDNKILMMLSFLMPVVRVCLKRIRLGRFAVIKGAE